MAKNTFFTGQPIFNQLLCFIPRSMVNQLSRQYNADRYCKRFKSYDHLVSMLFSSFHQCSSLRELITGLQANSHRLKHLGIVNTPRRSTLADANKRRPAALFAALFHKLYHYHYGKTLPDSSQASKLHERLFIVDSTTITLFSTALKGVGVKGANGRRKGGAKAHVLMRSKDQTPCFVHISAAIESDRLFMPMLQLPPHSIIVMDRAYVNYRKMMEWTVNHITWVTRMNDWSKWHLIEEKPVNDQDWQKGVRKDSVIMLGNPADSSRRPAQKARLIYFFDTETQKTFQFLSNNLDYDAATIAQLYKKRWEIELLFKRIKQNFQLRDFLGDNENAIKIQIWCTLIADLLISIVKDKIQKMGCRNWSFSNLAGLLRLHLNTYIDLFKFLLKPERALLSYCKEIQANQLLLFKT